MRIVKKLSLLLFATFIFPALVSLIWWLSVDRPGHWRSASWESAQILPPARTINGARIHIMAARTGGLKGAFSEHTWIVTKRNHDNRYTRYDKVGWGTPVRKNAYAADALWYSNTPRIIKTIHGDEAQKLIPEIEAAIANYPHQTHGSYRIWPGPNSNSFTAHILRAVPELDVVLPPTAVGRDFLAGDRLIHIDRLGRNLQLSLSGYFGVSLGRKSGVEIQLLGLVAGIDLWPLGIKLPGIGRIGF